MEGKYVILSPIGWRKSLLLASVFVATCGGCKSLGPMVIPRDRFNYNEAVARSSEQQMLLNLVRVRYDRAPNFIQVASMVSQYTFEAGANLGRQDNNYSVFSSPLLRSLAQSSSDDPGKIDRYGSNIRFVDTPTITYMPVQGEDYATRIMTPIPLETLGGFLIGGAVFLVFNAVMQEIIFRGVLLDAIRASWGWWVAILVTSVAFGLGHVHTYPPGVTGAVLSGIFGLALGMLRKHTGGLVMPVIAHIFADATIMGILAWEGGS